MYKEIRFCNIVGLRRVAGVAVTVNLTVSPQIDDDGDDLDNTVCLHMELIGARSKLVVGEAKAFDVIVDPLRMDDLNSYKELVEPMIEEAVTDASRRIDLSQIARLLRS